MCVLVQFVTGDYVPMLLRIPSCARLLLSCARTPGSVASGRKLFRFFTRNVRSRIWAVIMMLDMAVDKLTTVPAEQPMEDSDRT